jgi:hypothetical protein
MKRRTFLKGSALAGATTLVAAHFWHGAYLCEIRG